MGGTAIGTGRGDELSPALAKGRFDWVVVPSDVGLSTPEVYAHLDALRTHPDIVRAARVPTVHLGVLQALRAGDPIALAERARNDLQAAALSLRPQLREALELGEAGRSARRPRFGIGTDAGVPRGRPGVGARAAGRPVGGRLRGTARARTGARRAGPLNPRVSADARGTIARGATWRNDGTFRIPCPGGSLRSNAVGAPG